MNPSMPRGALSSVSIAMATYNGAAFLEEQLDSLETQTLKPDELVVCDDRSSDSTVDILRRFATRASFPVRIHVNPERLGWRANFMKASGLCTRELIAFCDQDDLWYPDKLQIMTAQFTDPAVLLAFHNADLINADAVIYDSLAPIETKIRIIPKLSRPTIWSNPFGLTIVFRRWLTRFNDLWPKSVDLSKPAFPAAHDQWFYFLATNLGDVIAVPQRLLAYRQHGKNTVGWEATPRSKTIMPRDQHVIQHAALATGMLIPFCEALETGASRENGALHDHLLEAAFRNRILAKRLELRNLLYKESRLSRRLARFLELNIAGAYGRDSAWGLGKRALLADMTVGLFRRHRDAEDKLTNAK